MPRRNGRKGLAKKLAKKNGIRNPEQVEKMILRGKKGRK